MKYLILSFSLLLISSCSITNKNIIYRELSQDAWVDDKDTLSKFYFDRKIIVQKYKDETDSIIPLNLRIIKFSRGQYATFEVNYIVEHEVKKFIYDYDFKNSLAITDDIGQIALFSRKRLLRNLR